MLGLRVKDFEAFGFQILLEDLCPPLFKHRGLRF